MLALADQALVKLAGEQRDFGLAKVMAEGAAGEADLLAAAGDQQGRVQLGLAFWCLQEGRDHGWTRAMRTSVLAGKRWLCLPFPGCLVGSMRFGSMGLRAPGVGSRRFFWLLFPTLSISCLVSFQVAWFRLPLTGGWLTWAAPAVRPARL